MADTGGERAAEPADHGARSAWLLPAAALVLGVALGGGVVAAGNLGSTQDLQDDDAASSAPSADAAAPVPRSSDLQVRVPASCLAAADRAEQVARSVDDVVAAARDLDARRLQELVDRFQRLQPEVEQLADRCREVAAERLQDGSLVTPAPSLGAS